MKRAAVDMDDGLLDPGRARTTVSEFVTEGLTDAAETRALDAVAGAFKLRITSAMRVAGDPVAAQLVPDAWELPVPPEKIAGLVDD